MAVFDAVIAEMTENRHYLTDQNLRQLSALIPGAAGAESLALENLEAEALEPGKILEKLAKAADRLYKLAATSDDADLLKVAATSMRQVLDATIKHSAQIDASTRALRVENALVDAVEEFNLKYPGVKDLFLKHLKQSLGE